jgi:hypothetical protein
MLQPRAEAPAHVNAPAPKRETPARKSHSPYAPPQAEPAAALLFKDEEITAASPAHEMSFNGLHPEKPAPEEEQQPVLVRDEPAPEPAAPPVIEPTPETARIPVRTPAAKELADAARVKESTLASVVARSVTLQTESAPPQDDMITFETPAATTITAVSATSTVIARKPAATEQQTFSLGEEDRGRFKDTEPSIVQGEDLDVPTWMRLKKKLRR